MIISPSLLAADLLNLRAELQRLQGRKNLWAHLDVMDGHFVPNLTFGPPFVGHMAREFRLPLDVHLMVTNPELHIERMKDWNIHNLTFHYEADKPRCGDLVKMAKKHYPSVGLSLRPETPLEEVPPEVVEQLDLLLVMSVGPGFSGQKFLPSTYDKLKKCQGLRAMIQVDGGVGLANCQQLQRAGAQNLVVGSALYGPGEGDFEERLQKLQRARA